MDIKKKIEKENNTSFMKNVLMLVIAQLVIKLLGFLYKLVILNVEGFGDIGNGYYNAGYQVYSLLLTISSVGIPTVISKLVSERIAIGDNKGAHRIFVLSLRIFTILGIILSVGLFLSSNLVANSIFNIPNVKYTLMVLSPAIMFVAASSVLRGYFSGLGSMKSTSISQTIEQFFNCVLTITFVYALIGKDPYIMAAGGNVSTTLSIIISFSYLLVFYKRRRKGIIEGCKNQEKVFEDKSTRNLIKTILAISIPMTLASLISVINNTIDTVTISNCVQKAYEGIIIGKQALEEEAMRLSGILSKVENLIHLPLAINAAFSTALVPAISSAMAKKDKETSSKRLSFSFFASMLIIMPCALGMAVLSEPILKLIYPAAPDGAWILALSTITMIFVALNYVINGGLYGLGKIFIPVISLIAGGAIKLILNIILISNPNINIYGATISSIVCQGLAFGICFVALNKHIKMNIKITKHIIKPILSATIMGILVFVSYKLLMNVFGNALSTVVSIMIGILIYTLTVILTRTLEKEDIYMMPYGTKIYNLLVKLKLYRIEEE